MEDTQCTLSLSDTSATLSRHLCPAIFSLRNVFIRTEENDQGVTGMISLGLCQERASQEHKQIFNGYQSKSVPKLRLGWPAVRITHIGHSQMSNKHMSIGFRKHKGTQKLMRVSECLSGTRSSDSVIIPILEPREYF